MIEFAIFGTPLSLQASTTSKTAWKGKVQARAREAVSEEERRTWCELSVTLLYYFFGEDVLDLDNIAKPILDGMTGVTYGDDSQIAQLTLRKTPLSAGLVVQGPSAALAGALDRATSGGGDFTYVIIADGPDHTKLP